MANLLAHGKIGYGRAVDGVSFVIKKGEALRQGEGVPENLAAYISVLSVQDQECLREELGESAYNELASGTGSVGLREGLAIQQCIPNLLGF